MPCRENKENTDRRASSLVNVGRRYAYYGSLKERRRKGSSAKRKARRAFYPKLPDEVAQLEPLYSLKKARIKEKPEERRPKSEIWRIFEAW